MNTLHIGFSNIIQTKKIVSILNPQTLSAKNIRKSASSDERLVDCTMGRKIRSMILTDSSHVFLSCIRPEALIQRLDKSSEKSSTLTAQAVQANK